jgi:hypothetical protein
MVNGKGYPGSTPYFRGKQSVWKLTFSNGKSISATTDHRFLLSNTGSKSKWCKVGHLKVGDRLFLNEFEPESVQINREFYEAFFIGALMGDGTLSNDGCPDLQLFKKGAKEIVNLLAASETIHKTAKARGGWRVSFNHRAYELMQKYDFVNKQSIRIANATQLLGYLSGLLVTDGSIDTRRATVSGGYSYLSQLQDYLLAYGYSQVGLHLSRRKGDKTNYGVATKDMYVLELSISSIRKMVGKLLLTRNGQKRIESLAGRKAQVRNPATRIVDISFGGNRNVYDITVPGIERFVANGLISHNCEHFLFNDEVALTRYGSSTVVNSNGAYPKITNPQLRPSICVSADTLIDTNEGLIKADSIVVGDKLLTMEDRPTLVTHTYQLESDKMHSITLESGRELRCSSDHPWLIWTSVNHLEWKHACDILVNDVAVVKVSKHPLTYERVVSNMKSKPETVFDFTTEAGHFRANSIVVHNCKHACAVAILHPKLNFKNKVKTHVSERPLKPKGKREAKLESFEAKPIPGRGRVKVEGTTVDDMMGDLNSIEQEILDLLER